MDNVVLNVWRINSTAVYLGIPNVILKIIFFKNS